MSKIWEVNLGLVYFCVYIYEENPENFGLGESRCHVF